MPPGVSAPAVRCGGMEGRMMIEIIHLERLRRERLAYEAAQGRCTRVLVPPPAGVLTLRDRGRRSALIGCCAALLGGGIIGSLRDRPLPDPARER